jgi:uncharacterized protein
MNYLDVEIEDDRIALDRRMIDAEGRMRVPDCRISAARVNDYLGSEIPGGAALGLDMQKIYRVYRDRKALKAAAPSFEGVQLLDDHVPVSALSPQKQRVVGTVSNVRWQAPYLVADLICWDASAIARIRDGSQKQISCGYGYVQVVEAGTVDGESFDIRMTEIVGNHVALVPLGRVGSDVVVADAMPRLARSMDEALPNFNRLGRGR